jgi:hypothetical protein
MQILRKIRSMIQATWLIFKLAVRLPGSGGRAELLRTEIGVVFLHLSSLVSEMYGMYTYGEFLGEFF